MNRTSAPLLLIILSSRVLAQDAGPVTAELENQTAWTGEGVPLYVTLYSPGPFSGAAAFDLPDLPRSAFIKIGSPVVGSEEIGDDTYFTQRHRFMLYTQQNGDITVPPIHVRFEGKPDFTSDPEPIEGSTPELHLQSNRPPGTESMPVVVTVEQLDVQQTWTPTPPFSIEAGDVVRRTIRQHADGLTAMMFAPPSTIAPDGVRVYTSDPVVVDRTERGVSIAERTDSIQYQFTQAGAFVLPELTFTWWDPQSEQLKHVQLEGQTVVVKSAPATQAAPKEPQSPWRIVGLLTAFALALWLARRPALHLWSRWQAYHNRPEALAVRRLRAACDHGDRAAAYAAFLDWKRALAQQGRAGHLEGMMQTEVGAPLRTEWSALSRDLFAAEPPSTTWDSAAFPRAFDQFRHAVERARHTSEKQSVLPALNPQSVRLH